MVNKDIETIFRNRRNKMNKGKRVLRRKRDKMIGQAEEKINVRII